MYLRILFILTGLLLTQVVVSGQNQANSESELRKRADKLFQDQEYLTAVGPYSQLLSLQPNDATLNYRYGTALLLSGKDKRNAVSYLEKTMNDPAQPMEGWVYLGRSYMFLGKYEDAKVVSTGLIPGQRTRSARSSIRKNGFVPRVPHRSYPVNAGWSA